MPQLLLELFSEEIPARMQAQAARDLERMARERLAEAGFLPEALTTFAGPRRLTLVAEGLPIAQPDRNEERKGPKIGAPQAALDGFLRSTGLTQDQLTERDGTYFAITEKKGQPTSEVIAEMVEAIVRNFPWPKSMKWGTGSLRWVRPLQRILCVFDAEIVPFAFEGLESGDLTEGHRFMGTRQPFRARNFEAYAAGLEANFVVLDVAERKARIVKGAETLCFARGLELVEDQGLLDEVAGLAEWPIPILGDMDPAFLDLPPEVIRTSMRTHQKYFAVRRPGQTGLAAHFLVVANIEAPDGGQLVAVGNARVLSARLNDARFFWDEDRKTRLEDRLDKLKTVTFHAKLGTLYQRSQRISALARQIAPLVGADSDLAARAGLLAKADLTCGMVGEFPELQGIMGGYYARAEGLPPSPASPVLPPRGEDLTGLNPPPQGEGPNAIADAIRDHYKPQGPGDTVPTAPVSVAVALAEKLDTLIGFFAIDEKPTGSKDPFALRRAALGVIRLLTGEALDLRAVCLTHANAYFGTRDPNATIDSLMAFFLDRLAVVLHDQDGFEREWIAAAFANLGTHEVLIHRLRARVAALSAFLGGFNGANLLAGYRRATNILKGEDKKGGLPSGPPEQMADAPDEEIALLNALSVVRPKVDDALANDHFEDAMVALSALREPVDAFFEKVFVNEPEARDNRLRLLADVRATMERVADFSLING
jgi:glycyl-tRNA synthetase beta chain